MASPPFDLDITDPTDTSIGDAFPANERSFRDNVNSYLNTEHDINTGYHAFQELTTTQKTALSTPPTGMLVYDTTLSQLQINTGTSGSPTWTNVSVTQGLYHAVNAPGATTYSATAAQNGTLFTSQSSAGGNLTVTLPNTSTISAGYTLGFLALGGNTISAAVQGSTPSTF